MKRQIFDFAIFKLVGNQSLARRFNATASNSLQDHGTQRHPQVFRQAQGDQGHNGHCQRPKDHFAPTKQIGQVAYVKPDGIADERRDGQKHPDLGCVQSMRLMQNDRHKGPDHEKGEPTDHSGDDH